MNPKIRFMNVSKGFSLYSKQSEKLFDIVSLKKIEIIFSLLEILVLK